MAALGPIPVVLFSFGMKQNGVVEAMEEAGFEASDS